MTDRFTRMRAATLRLVIMLMAVNGIALALVTWTGIEENGRRTTFGVAWLAASLAVIVPGLKAVRAARRS
jgi:hypothetical protein